MPILNIQIMQGHDARQKAALLKNCSTAVVDSIGAPLPSIRIVLEEVAPEHVIVAGEIGKAMALVVVRLIAGRTDAQKAALIAALSSAIHTSVNISQDDVRVILADVPKTDMGVAGGITAQAAGR
ncbi:4-oxalocrotonate tautomerase [Bordetella genomosp. 7]|uniref:tautomerase family protein n=1 Tax=Bordetella TaxID=517 RepID=UPI00047E9D43|nr:MULTISPECIES: tautomerase family protein [Bordetella]OZI22289.1 4-oxalocrotonate tautomerase [Bordetella genomosp. 7]